MLDDGSIDEVKKIYKKYKDKNLIALSGIGYREIIKYLDKEITLEEAINKIKQNTRHYAKRQMTWFRRMEKQGLKIYWNKTPAQINKISKTFLE